MTQNSILIFIPIYNEKKNNGKFKIVDDLKNMSEK